jgi:hypothetical protein
MNAVAFAALGSWPGTDYGAALGAQARVADAAPEGALLIDSPPELPARGPEAGIVGRSLALLADLPAGLEAHGWRLAARPDAAARRARALLAADLERWAERAAAARRPVPLKVQCAGPWTLAATTWLPVGERASGDRAAAGDIAASLAEGLAAHLEAVRDLTGRTDVIVQLDEPALGAVLRGELPTFSGRGRLAPIPGEDVAAGLAPLVAALVTGFRERAAAVVLHCCDQGAPTPELALAAGVPAVSLDLTDLAPARWEALAEAVEGGLALWAGVGGLDDLAGPWRALGLGAGPLARTVLTPPCGLAGDPDAEAALTAVGRAAAKLAESLDAGDFGG